ncbi:MAG: S24 family peptidase [Leptothrix ochracea]|uniref:S24 family peptidase n=1 Tax=Leptothrix ochracea TaxID=735331 RepID=UPI0034E25E7D
MSASARRIIPIQPLSEPAPDEGACSSGESFALRVLGDSMLPEFAEGDIVIIEPEGVVREGAFVLAETAEGWTLGQLARAGDTDWSLTVLNPAYPSWPLASFEAIAGVVIQKVKPGRRRQTRWYVE